MDAIAIFLIILAGLAAGFLNAVSGGGAMLTVPALIFIGIPPVVANGTNRIAVAVQSLAALIAYQRLKVTNNSYAFGLAVPAMLGSGCGALVSVRLDDEVFRGLLAVTMVLLLVPIFFQTILPTDTPPRRDSHSWSVRVVFFAIGLYGGVMQIGVGIIILSALSALGGLNLVHANAVKVAIVMLLSSLAMFVFIAAGQVNWTAGLLLAASNSLGSWCGAHWGVRKGDYWIRVVVAVTVVLMALQLLGVLSWAARLLYKLAT